MVSAGAAAAGGGGAGGGTGTGARTILTGRIVPTFLFDSFLGGGVDAP